MSVFDTNWERVYGVFDGIMPQCPGVSCPKACCSADKAFLTPGDECVKYNTTLIDPSELRYQFSVEPSFEELGIEVIRGFLKERIQVGYGRIDSVIALRGCMGDGVCKLVKDAKGKNRKPVLCSAFPFRLNHFERPLYGVSTCPKALEIGRDLEIVYRISVVRSMIGIDEYKGWLANLRRMTGE